MSDKLAIGCGYVQVSVKSNELRLYICTVVRPDYCLRPSLIVIVQPLDNRSAGAKTVGLGLA